MNQELKKMVGQMLMAGFPSEELDDQAKQLLDDFQVGNFIYFARNMKNTRQVARLSQALSENVYKALGMAPLIAADQEGGAVSRLTEGAALMPGAMAAAAAGSLDWIRQLGENCGKILRSVGVNMDLAPDMDVNIEPANPIIGSRSYGDNPDQVAERAIVMMQGLEAGGVLPTLKHFPGHGNVNSDSHLGIPINNTSREELERTEFRPFQQGVEAGAKAILTAHVRYAQVDAESPATLSKTIVTGLLREQYGYDGLILTDCLEMDAVRKAYGCGEGAVRAIEAGADLLTISHTYEAVSQAAHAIYEALDSGRLTPQRIQESYDRILKVKRAMGLLEPQKIWEDEAAETAMNGARLMLCRQVATNSVTLLSGEVTMGPERPDFLVIAPDSQASNGAEDMRAISLVERAAARFGCLGAKIPLDGDSKDALKMVQSAVKMGFTNVILGLYNARLRESQVQVLRELENMGQVNLVVVLLGAPYDAKVIRRANGVLACYEYTALSVEALLDAIAAGEFPGQCPVQL